MNYNPADFTSGDIMRKTEKEMNVLITGASFANRGAQSMLFTVVNEVKSKYDSAEFYYLPTNYFKENCFENCADYRFTFVYDDLAVCDFPIKYGFVGKLKRRMDSKIISDRIAAYNVPKLSDLWDKLDVLIDISGYSLTSKFGISSINRMLRHIRKAQSLDIPVILMPQSYGPLNFGEKTEAVCREIGEAFSKIDLLFAREQEGMEVLLNECGVNNAVLSPDIVLQAKEIDWENVFAEEPVLNVHELSTEGNVGIVPNGETVKNGNKEFVLNCYQRIIRQLREKNKEIYIFRHSDDLSLCRDIYALVKDDEHCHLIEDEMNCMEYGAFVKQFDFVIASRFHSVVHAYREGIPAFVLGWAIKYQELTKLLGQEEYAFDITKANEEDIDTMLEKLEQLTENYADETKLISEKLELVRQKNCFDLCWEVMDKI